MLNTWVTPKVSKSKQILYMTPRFLNHRLHWHKMSHSTRPFTSRWYWISPMGVLRDHLKECVQWLMHHHQFLHWSYLAVRCGGPRFQVQHVGAEIEQSCCCLLHRLQDFTNLFSSLWRSDVNYRCKVDELSFYRNLLGGHIYQAKGGEGSKKLPVQHHTQKKQRLLILPLRLCRPP